MLQAAAADADMSSEDLALSFVNGEMTIEEFKRNFVNARTDAHKLKLKSEKILQQATNQQSGYSGPQMPSGAPPYQHYRYYFINTLHVKYIVDFRNPPPVPGRSAPAVPQYHSNSAFPAYPPNQPF